MMRVKLASGEWTTVYSLREASREVRRYIEANCLGPRDFVGGVVVDDAGNRIAEVSYNGRVWDELGLEVDL